VAGGGSEKRKFAILITAQGTLLALLYFVKKEIFSMSKHESYNGVFISNNGQFSRFFKISAPPVSRVVSPIALTGTPVSSAEPPEAAFRAWRLGLCKKNKLNQIFAVKYCASQ